MRSVAACCLAGLVLLTAGPVEAQNRLGGRLNDPTRGNPIQQWQQRAAESELLGLIALEGSLDATEYRVGPGDVFSVSAGGAFPIVVAVPVSADGNLVLPEAGAIPAAGRTLETVQREATEALQRRYRNVQVEVTLTLPRQFYVHITGAVPEPGRYLTLPLARVDDALQQAFAAQVRAQPDPTADGALRIVGSATAQRPTFNPAFRPSLRNVRVQHRDGSVTSLDLMYYYNTGDTEQNPYLLDGDVVTVPSYHEQRDGVRVSGDVAYPGTFDFRPGDTILGLLALAAGPVGFGDIEEVRLTRRSGARAETEVYRVADLAGGQDVALTPGDHVNVPPRTFAEAAIQGLVRYPGTYPIEDGETTLRELVALAGGLKPDAEVRGAFIERRKSLQFKEDGRVSDLDFFERAYLRGASGANRLVIDVEEALGESGQDIVLYDEDRVVFPRDEGTVFVTGNVPQPGYVVFVEGQPARYYIAEAGGEGPLSSGIYVFEEGSGQILRGNNAPVRAGDTIFVNRERVAESPEVAALLISEESSRRQARILTVQTAITSLTAALSIIATLKSFGAFE